MTYRQEVADDELTYQIIGAAIDIHTALGSDMPEHVYRDSLARRLRKTKRLECQVEYPLDVVLDGEVVATRRADLFVAGEVILELKVVKIISESHMRQLGVNVRAAGVRRGLVLNFGAATLGIRRWANGWEVERGN